MLRAVTVALGITLCRSSVTTPEIAPEVDCALVCQGVQTTRVSSKASSLIVLFM
jgi:hypothetical protein